MMFKIIHRQLLSAVQGLTIQSNINGTIQSNINGTISNGHIPNGYSENTLARFMSYKKAQQYIKRYRENNPVPIELEIKPDNATVLDFITRITQHKYIEFENLIAENEVRTCNKCNDTTSHYIITVNRTIGYITCDNCNETTFIQKLFTPECIKIILDCIAKRKINLQANHNQRLIHNQLNIPTATMINLDSYTDLESRYF